MEWECPYYEDGPHPKWVKMFRQTYFPCQSEWLFSHLHRTGAHRYLALLRPTKITINYQVTGNWYYRVRRGAVFVFCLKFKFISFLHSLAVDCSVTHRVLSVSVVLQIGAPSLSWKLRLEGCLDWLKNVGTFRPFLARSMWTNTCIDHITTWVNLEYDGAQRLTKTKRVYWHSTKWLTTFRETTTCTHWCWLKLLQNMRDVHLL